MALIKCMECGKEISDSAKKCIHCGCPVNKEKNNNTLKYIIIGIVIVIVVILGYLLFIRKSYVGKWEHNINWQVDGETVRSSYSFIELNKDNTFKYVGYNKGDENRIEFTGTYNYNDNVIYIYYSYENENYSDQIFVEDGKLCLSEKNCDDYYIMSDSKDENTLNLKEVETDVEDDNDTSYNTDSNESSGSSDVILTSEITYINYSEYKRILNNREDAVVVFVADWCSHCAEFKEVLKNVKYSYITPIYYYDASDMDNIEVDGINAVPTTYIIKNGEVVNTKLGKIDEDELNDFFKENNVD